MNQRDVEGLIEPHQGIIITWRVLSSLIWFDKDERYKWQLKYVNELFVVFLVLTFFGKKKYYLFFCLFVCFFVCCTFFFCFVNPPTFCTEKDIAWEIDLKTNAQLQMPIVLVQRFSCSAPLAYKCIQTLFDTPFIRSLDKKKEEEELPEGLRPSSSSFSAIRRSKSRASCSFSHPERRTTNKWSIHNSGERAASAVIRRVHLANPWFCKLQKKISVHFC